MSTIITAVENTTITHATIVRIDTGTEIYRITNIYSPVTYNSETYLPLGNLLATSDILDDITASNADMTISLSGIDQDAISLVLATPIKGSAVQVYRVFLDSATGQPLPNQIYLRYDGYVTSFSINENLGSGDDSQTVGIVCASTNSLLESQTTGRYTRPSDQKRFYPGDISMDRVVSLNRTTFDFGWTPTPVTPTT